MSKKLFSAVECRSVRNRCKAGNKCRALKIWQKYTLILKKCCFILQIQEITSNNKKLSKTNSTSLYSVYAVQLQKKLNKIEPRNSKSLVSLIRECTFWKNCNQLLWLLLCTVKSAGDTFGFLWQPEVKKAKEKPHLFCEEFSTLSPLKSN